MACAASTLASAPSKFPVSAESLLEEIGRYDAADAAAVSRRVRCEAGREAVVDTLLELYREVLTQEAPAGTETEAEATYHYLRKIGVLFKEAASIHRQLGEEREALAALRRTTGVRLQGTLTPPRALRPMGAPGGPPARRPRRELSKFPSRSPCRPRRAPARRSRRSR